MFLPALFPSLSGLSLLQFLIHCKQSKTGKVESLTPSLFCPPPQQSVVIWCDMLGDIQSGSDALPWSGPFLPRQVSGGREATRETLQHSMYWWDVSGDCRTILLLLPPFLTPSSSSFLFVLTSPPPPPFPSFLLHQLLHCLALLVWECWQETAILWAGDWHNNLSGGHCRLHGL